jgi:alpha-ketoglutarate-dependent taurine dioxygenase
MKLAIRPIQGEFCAEVIGADLSRPMDDAGFAQIERAWTRHSILVFRDARMTPEQQIAFTRRFGPLHIMEPLQYNLPDHPEIFVVSNVEEGGKAIGMKRAGWGWHSDGEDKAMPNAGSFLYALELPPEGGDTLFADMYGAFESLPPDVQRQIMGKRACFSRVRLHHVHYPHLPALTEEEKVKRPDVWHPLTRRHPKSGWTALYVGRWACEVEGLPAAEGEELIRHLQEFAVQSERVYRHRWRPGDAVLWDNRCAQHCATPFDDEKYRRHMHRTTIEGEVPLMATAPTLRSQPRSALSRQGSPSVSG